MQSNESFFREQPLRPFLERRFVDFRAVPFLLGSLWTKKWRPFLHRTTPFKTDAGKCITLHAVMLNVSRVDMAIRSASDKQLPHDMKESRS